MLYQRAVKVRKKQNIETVTTDHSSVKFDLTCGQKVISEFKKKKKIVSYYVLVKYLWKETFET